MIIVSAIVVAAGVFFGERWSHQSPDTLNVGQLAAAPTLDGTVGEREYGAPNVKLPTGAGIARIWVKRHASYVYIAAEFPDSTHYWGDDFVVSLDPAGDGGGTPGLGDRQWYLRRTLDSSIVTTVNEAGRWYSSGNQPAMLGPTRHGPDWDVASGSTRQKWSVELRIRSTAIKPDRAVPRIAFRTYNDEPTGWWSWPAPPSGIPAQRVERSPDLWAPMRLR